MTQICFVSACHRPATAAATIRILGNISRWMLCEGHAAMLHNPDLPEWFQVRHVGAILRTFPTDAEEATHTRHPLDDWEPWLYEAWEVHDFAWQPDDFEPERKGHRLCSAPKCHSTPEWTVVTGVTDSIRCATCAHHRVGMRHLVLTFAIMHTAKAAGFPWPPANAHAGSEVAG